MSRIFFARFTRLAAACAALCAVIGPACAAPGDFPITPGQRSTAQQVAQAGVPLAELAPNAPDSYTVKKGDTLWGISGLFLKSPWRWPELWGMNLEQIRNPHLIYPGQLLILEKVNGRARLIAGRSVETLDSDRLEPRIRNEPLLSDAISSVPMHLIGPFLNDAVVFDDDSLNLAPRIVATQEGRVLLSRGETAYVRGNVESSLLWQIFRQPKPLIDPESGQVLGFEARNVGTAERVALPDSSVSAGSNEVLPSTFRITQLREEAGLGDRLAPLPGRDFSAFAPHSPAQALSGRIVSIYGDGLYAGQNQIVSLNRGQRDGMERGHVLALWRAGKRRPDMTDPSHPMVVLPDERHGLLFVFRVFDRVSYALILNVKDPVGKGDRFTQP